ncbi:hypothetical protein NL526_29570, partial [Klebsiella pneumoniae]|nr:hypothetical protein [Klebsiella pneumoniae]
MQLLGEPREPPSNGATPEVELGIVPCSAGTGSADAKGKRDNTSAMTLSLPAWCSIRKLYSDS